MADITKGRMPEPRARGRPKMNWMNDVTSWTGLTIEGAIRAANDRKVWRMIVYDVTNPRIEDRTGNILSPQVFLTYSEQRHFTKRISGFSKLSYDERLASLNCVSFYSRRVKCDLVMCHQMLTGSVNIDTITFFTRYYLSTTRGNSMKLFKPQFTSVCDGNFFRNRVISHRNLLSNSLVPSSSVASFKCKLSSLNYHL